VSPSALVLPCRPERFYTLFVPLPTRNSWFRWLVYACLSGGPLWACSSARNTAKADAPGAPAKGASLDLEALLRREIDRLPERPVAFPKPDWSARVESSSAPEVSWSEDTVVVDIPIGTQDAIRCYVYPDDVDPAGSLARVLAEAKKKATFEKIAPVDISVEVDAPALHLAALYTTRGPLGLRAAGELELIFHARPAHPVLCMHDEPGYRKSFRRIALEFSGSLRTEADPTPQPAWLEVQVARIGKTPVGFTRRAMVPSETGGSLTLQTGSFMLPAGDDTWMFGDEGSFSEANAAGRIERAAFAQFSGSQELINLRLEKQPSGSYRVVGTRRGKAMTAEFRTRDPAGLPDRVLVGRWLLEQARVEAEEFHPNLDAEHPLVVTYERGRPGQVSAQLGSAQLVASLDPRGLFRQMDITTDKTTMSFARVLVRPDQ
jgi:hypothetical protein